MSETQMILESWLHVIFSGVIKYLRLNGGGDERGRRERRREV
jgi:hypothetical protein